MIKRRTMVLWLVGTILFSFGVAADDSGRYHVLVANDDGVDAPGIVALVKMLAKDPAYRVTVVAPAEQQSAMSHALTVRGDIQVSPHDSIAGCPTWAVSATPATTVRVALLAVLSEDPPDLVLSGINRGDNVGSSAWYSGTVGAAREAVIFGLPAIALSLRVNWSDPQPDYAAAASHAKPVVDAVRKLGLPAGVVLNVNIPADTSAIRGYRLTNSAVGADHNSFEVVREENGVRWYKSDWEPAEGAFGTDSAAIRAGWVTLTPLGLDQTQYHTLPLLQLGLGPAAPVSAVQ